MKKELLVFTLLIFISSIAFSQARKKKNDKYIYVSSALNYTPPFESYSFLSALEREQDFLLLTFLTPVSGTFILEDGQTINVDRENISQFPSQLLGIGASFQILNSSSFFHEISLTKVSMSKSSYVNNFTFTDSSGTPNIIRTGYEQKTSIFGIRYELGTYFKNKRKHSKVSFGISGGIEPMFFSYKRVSLSINEFPINAKFTTISISVNPIMRINLSKKVFLEFKVVPNILVADFGNAKEKNPTVSLNGQEGNREYDLPEINLGYSLMVKYQLKEPKKKRRRKKTTD